MPFCPLCKFEYVLGASRCPECGEQLVDSLPREPAEPVDELSPVALRSTKEARDLAGRMMAAGRLSCIGSGGIAGTPTNDQIIQARAWGAAQGRHIVDALVEEGYGARFEQHDMALVFTPLAFCAFLAAGKGLKGMVDGSAVHYLPGVLPVEWSVWVPKRHPTITGEAYPYEVALAFSPVLYQEGRRVEPVKVDREKTPIPPIPPLGHGTPLLQLLLYPLLRRWGPEAIVTVTAYYRLDDLRLGCPTDLSFFLCLRDFSGWAQCPDRKLSFTLDFGRLS